MGVKKKFLDTNLKHKSKTVEETLQFVGFEGKKLPLPTEIEISESGTCNRKCSFCPRSAPDFIDKKEFITNDLHLKLCKELEQINYKGTIRYSGFVEPLLDKNIFNLILSLFRCISTGFTSTPKVVGILFVSMLFPYNIFFKKVVLPISLGPSNKTLYSLVCCILKIFNFYNILL